MGTARFDVGEVRALVDGLKDGQEIIIVGDEGVYLMCREQHPRTIVYAQGCDPRKGGFFREHKVAVWGGDDGSEPVGKAREWRRALEREDVDEVKVRLRADTLQIIFMGPKAADGGRPQRVTSGDLSRPVVPASPAPEEVPSPPVLEVPGPTEEDYRLAARTQGTPERAEAASAGGYGQAGPARGVGARCRQLIAGGLSNADVLARVREEFAGARTSAASVAWYRSQMKREADR